MEPNATVVCNEVYTEYLYSTFNFILCNLFNCQLVLSHFLSFTLCKSVTVASNSLLVSSSTPDTLIGDYRDSAGHVLR
jgi:hypothetical protein